MSVRRLSETLLNIVILGVAAVVLRAYWPISDEPRAFNIEMNRVATSFDSLITLGTTLQDGDGPELIIISSYDCPACARIVQPLMDLLHERPDLHISILHLSRNRNLANSPEAAAICLSEQGQLSKIVHAALFDAADTIPTLSSSCLRAAAARLAATAKITDLLRVRGTPTFLTRKSWAEGVEGLAVIWGSLREPPYASPQSSSRMEAL